MSSSVTSFSLRYPQAQPQSRKSEKAPSKTVSMPRFTGVQKKPEPAVDKAAANEAHFTFTPELRPKILNATGLVYGEDKAEEVTRHIEHIIGDVQKKRPKELLKEDYERHPLWFKRENVYMFYADRFGTQNGKPTTFKSLIPMLDYAKGLGASTLYMLPFMKSPMVDAGFDVSDYKKVREELGGDKEFDAFAKAARQKGFKLKADLVLNHVSEQHPWFQAALKGDPEKLKYFLARDTAPDVRVKDSKKGKKFAIYKEDYGLETKRELNFPEFCTTQYRKDNINGKDKYFYHTWYPHQVDLNWRNPKVLYEALNVMGHWANRGIDMFRMDALEFFIKNPGTTGKNSAETHALTQILSSSLRSMSPRSVLWGEVDSTPKMTQAYYGNEVKTAIPVPSFGPKIINRTDKLNINYNFPLMPALWSALTQKNTKTFWQVMNAQPRLPFSAGSANFLTVHDDVTLRNLPDSEERKRIYDAMVPNGMVFRKDSSVTGRLSNFLGQSPERINLANSLLYSLPGIPIMYYGNEVGATNSHHFMLKTAAHRAEEAAKTGTITASFVDGRDLHRAPVEQETFQKAVSEPNSHAGKIYHHAKKIIHLRNTEPALQKGELYEAKNDNHQVLSYIRSHKGERILILNNLTDSEQKTTLSMSVSGAFKDLKDMITGKPVDISTDAERNELRVALKPYESMWVKLNGPFIGSHLAR